METALATSRKIVSSLFLSILELGGTKVKSAFWMSHFWYGEFKLSRLKRQTDIMTWAFGLTLFSLVFSL